MVRKENPKIIVCGNQRSGTNAIGQLLARAGDLSRVMDTVSEYKRFTDPLKLDEKADFEDLIENQPEAVDYELVKCSQFTWISNWMEDVWPGVVLVFVIRDPRATIRSQLDRIDYPGDRNDFNPSECYRLTDSWEAILSGRLLECSRDHYVSTLAARWAKAVRIYLERRERAVLIQYEEFCRHKTAAINDLAERCGVDVCRDISPLVDRKWQVTGENRGCDWEDFFGLENLARIEAECADEMQELGYERMGAPHV